jgi:Sec-independent protein translocase protein TatA
MEILNIGPFEVILIVIIALILLGPTGMIEFMRKAGKWIRKIIRSPLWKDILSTSKEIRSLPQKIVREADLEEEFKEFEAWRAQKRGIEKNLQKSINEINSEISIKPSDFLKKEIISQTGKSVEKSEQE